MLTPDILENSWLVSDKNGPSFPAFAGITTNLAGNFAVYDDDRQAVFCLNNRLYRNLNADYYHKLIADHGDKIIMASSCGDLVHGDGIISCEPDFLKKKKIGDSLFSNTADSPIVVFASTDQRMIAIIHSGWKGCRLGIIPKALVQMRNQCAIAKTELWAAIFPGICKNCYEVGPEVGNLFPEHFANGHLDLKAVIMAQMEPYLDPQKMFIVPYCSAHTAEGDHQVFESHRFNRTGKRNVVFVVRKFK
jgi:copper oxidase (laccase) domain-containing protein